MAREMLLSIPIPPLTETAGYCTQAAKGTGICGLKFTFFDRELAEVTRQQRLEDMLN